MYFDPGEETDPGKLPTEGGGSGSGSGGGASTSELGPIQMPIGGVAPVISALGAQVLALVFVLLIAFVFARRVLSRTKNAV